MGDLFTPVHLIIVLGIALLVFGPKRLPELGAGLGKSLREFREATSGVTTAFSKETIMPVETPRPFVPPGTPTGAGPFAAAAAVAVERASDLGDMDTGG